MRKRFYLLSLGCPKNTVDAEAMIGLLEEDGWRRTGRPDRADVLIVNTCGFIDAARAESYGALQELAEAKRSDQVLLAAGCLAQRSGQGLRQTVPGVDGILGTREWPNIVPCIQELLGYSLAAGDGYSLAAGDGYSLAAGDGYSLAAGDGYSLAAGDDMTPAATAHPPGEVSVVSPMRRQAQGPSAYLKIADGCSAPCAFCAIPTIKGPQRSKARPAILDEARQLLSRGTQEIILIAQDTTAYGRDLGESDGLPSLIEDILMAVPPLPWLRLMYAYPQHITPRLIETMATYPQVCHYLDLPLQHAHPATLRRMRRSPDVAGVRRLIADLRQAMPDMALRTAFIVGYPGETEEEFVTLLDFMAEGAFDKVGVFLYSAEEGTAAATLPDAVPRAVAEERYERAMELQRGISLARNQMQVGRTLDVLIEGTTEELSVGRSYRDAPEIDGYVLLSGQWPVGQLVKARIERALEYDLQGQVIER